MDKQIKTIGVLTSGGDAPGMNAAIRAVVRTAVARGIKVLGIRRGYNGLIEGDVVEMNGRSVSDTIQRGGTLLYTARCKEFMTPAGRQRGVDICKIYGIDGLVVIGGDGSFRGAESLSHLGVNTIGIPGTIDLDINCSDYTIGFDTAVNTAMHAIDKIKETSTSHERCSLVEVMGREAGYIAQWCGIINGAEAILIPEAPVDESELIRHILENKKKGKKHNLIIVAEGVGGTIPLAEKIEQITGIETRATILGYLQRGGSPTAIDRMRASEMGAYAVDLLCQGKTNRIVAYKDGKYTDFDIDEGLSMPKKTDLSSYSINQTLEIQ